MQQPEDSEEKDKHKQEDSRGELILGRRGNTE
jgi:hypothetical protein